MKNHFTKIVVFILTGLIIVACDITKHIPKGKRLLVKTELKSGKKNITDEDVQYQLYQKPNTSILGYRLRLHLYNLARQKSDSVYHVWLDKNPQKHKTLTALLSEKQVNRLGKSFVISGLNEFLIKTGEKPVLLDSIKTKKSLGRLNSYYFNRGFFDVKSTYTTDTSKAKKVVLKYNIAFGTPFLIDSLKTNIKTPVLDSLYNLKKNNSLIKVKKQYLTDDFDNERSRITYDFRNSGAYFFQPNYILYDLDTIDTHKKINVKLIIQNQPIRENDTTKTVPFKLYKINKVDVYTDHIPGKVATKITDSIEFKNVNLYSEKKLKYRPRSITDPIFIKKGAYYSDVNSNLTTKYLSNLKVFNYPIIQYKVDPKDTNGLIASIYLTPRKKYSFGYSADFIHSNIQDFGISGNTSLGIRNIFNGAETFEIGFRGNVGASRDQANPNNNFFNISEIGVDAKLNFPRILSPINTNKIIPKSMLPFTTFSVGFAKQRNIGLDKQSFSSSFSYNWTPKKNTTARLELINIQFIKNVNVSNYFNIYKSSYNNLNAIANNYPKTPEYFNPETNQLIIETGTNGFIGNVIANPTTVSEDDLRSVRSIEERKNRLTENNLIFSSSYSFTKSTKKDLYDNTFYAIKTKIESAGNLLSLFARASKQIINQGGPNTIFDVQYSQYLKGEFEYIKHWNLSGKQVFAVRTFSGLAVPYGNSKSIPFSRSYFSGGSNDNRAWQPYSLGPGKSGGVNDFNEANLKLSFNAELRFNMVGKINGALFADAGNIWNVFDDVTDINYKFKGLKSLPEIALGTGFGVRYDQGLFVIRLDLGFKTYNPAKEENEKWFRELNFSKSVINIGINYPF